MLPLGWLRRRRLAHYFAWEADQRVWEALDGWRGGVPRYEIALLNRLTERLSKVEFRRAGMLLSGMPGVTRIHNLHGAGGRVPGQQASTDAYGADFAVTVEVRPLLVKTAFFQLKKIHGDPTNPRVRVEKSQLEQARAYKRVWDRSFLVAVGESSGPAFLRSAKELYSRIPKGRTRHDFPVSLPAWIPSGVWIFFWLCCLLGPPTLDDDPDPVEARLARFTSLIDEQGEGRPPEDARERFPEFARLQAWVRFAVGNE